MEIKLILNQQHLVIDRQLFVVQFDIKCEVSLACNEERILYVEYNYQEKEEKLVC